jgi:hypothetical protein
VRIKSRIVDLAAVRARVHDVHARHDARIARQRRGDERHRQLVGAGLDGKARRSDPALREVTQRGLIAQMQPDRTGVVLAKHDAVERTLRRQPQCPQIDVAIARARLQIRGQRAAELTAQLRFFRTLLVRLRRIGQIGVGLQLRPHVARERKACRVAERRHTGRREPHDRAEQRERRGRTRRAERRQIAEARVALRDRDARNARGDQPAVDGHVARHDVRVRVGWRILPQPARDALRVTGRQVVAEQRSGRFGDADARDLPEQTRQLRRDGAVVERYDDERRDGRQE